MTGESGAERVKNTAFRWQKDLLYNYAAKQVDDKVLAALAKNSQMKHSCREI